MNVVRSIGINRSANGDTRADAIAGPLSPLRALTGRALGGTVWGLTVTALLIYVTSPPLSGAALLALAVLGALEGALICCFRERGAERV
jgi:hypothetical protein